MALNDNAGKPRKPTRNFASLRATFSRSTTPVTELERKTEPNLVNVDIKPLPVVPTSNLDRRQSKMSLFEMFSKPKVERARGYGNEPGLESLPERSQTPAHFYNRPEKRQPPPESILESVVQSRPASRMSGSTLAASSQSGAPPKSPRPVDDWDPIPLFQAYPQSVKHGTLQGTNLSADVILRSHHLRRQNHGLFGSTTSLPFVREGSDDGFNQQEPAWQTAKRFSTLSEVPELVEKVFVLVTAGRLVQYAGDGNYDRMPEKVLQLGEKSAAFACDLIPGKHWVVQVVQSVNDQGVSTINKSRSLLSRLRMPSSTSRKTTTSFLLIFSSAEDMDSWLKAIRRVIQQLGGKGRESDPETKHSRKNTAEKLADELPTHRFRLQKAPSESQGSRTRSSSSHSQTRSSHNPTSDQPPASSVSSSTHSAAGDSPRHSASDADGNTAQPHRGTSTEASSLATTPASIDQVRLDRLRDGSRHSIISVRTSRTSETDTITIPTSRCSSSPPSPHVEAFIEPNHSPPPMRISYISPISSTSLYRRSVQPLALERTDGTTARAERITQVQRQPRADAHEQNSPVLRAKAAPVPSTILENPRSRASQIYPRAMASRQQSMDRFQRPSTEIEPGARGSRPDSAIGQLPGISTRSVSRPDQPRRPFFRPLPIRPSEPASAGQSRAPEAYIPRRFSSLPVSGAPSQPLPIGPAPMSMNRPRAPSYSLTPSAQAQAPAPSAPPAKMLRRPTSLQIRSDPAPFLSSSRRQTPVSHSVTSAPTVHFSAAAAAPQPPPPIPPMNPSRPNLLSRTSIMVPGLPPPAPPPNCPLPAPPPQMTA
jgi:hypothetical protein